MDPVTSFNSSHLVSCAPLTEPDCGHHVNGSNRLRLSGLALLVWSFILHAAADSGLSLHVGRGADQQAAEGFVSRGDAESRSAAPLQTHADRMRTLDVAVKVCVYSCLSAVVFIAQLHARVVRFAAMGAARPKCISGELRESCYSRTAWRAYRCCRRNPVRERSATAGTP